MKSQAILGQLESLLDQLALGSAQTDERSHRVATYRRLSLDRAADLLQYDVGDRLRRRFELRLRLALHLAPVDAIQYDRQNPTPRWRLINDYLVDVLGRDPAEASALARQVAIVLDNWDRNREAVTHYRGILVKRDPHCANCHVAFGQEPVSLRRQDPFKPYYLSPEELLQPEVDHVEAISGLGTNLITNLQLLCRLCNAGKGDGLGLDVRGEARFAGMELESIPRSHRASMLYYVIERDSRTCRQCEATDRELVIRPSSAAGGFLLSNLYAVCVICSS